jgi:hypothetical protein
MEHQYRLGRIIRKRDAPDLVLADKRHSLAVRRNSGRPSCSQAAELAALDGNDEDGLLHAVSQQCWIGVGAAGKFEITAVHVYDRLSIWRPGNVTDVLPIIGRVSGQLPGGGKIAARQIGNPDIPFAFLVCHPNHSRTLRGSLQLGIKRAAHDCCNVKFCATADVRFEAKQQTTKTTRVSFRDISSSLLRNFVLVQHSFDSLTSTS